MSFIRESSLPIFIEQGTPEKEQLDQLMDVFRVAINDVEQRLALKESADLTLSNAINEVATDIEEVSTRIDTLQSVQSSHLTTIESNTNRILTLENAPNNNTLDALLLRIDTFESLWGDTSEIDNTVHPVGFDVVKTINYLKVLDDNLQTELSNHKNNKANPHEVNANEVPFVRGGETNYLTTDSAHVDDALVKLDAQIKINKDYIDTEIAAVIGNAPGILDTLSELADAINDDANFVIDIKSVQDAHVANKSNPHDVGAEQVAISNVTLNNYIKLSANTNQALKDLDVQLKTVTDDLAQELIDRASADSILQSNLDIVDTKVDNHIADTDNPHETSAVKVDFTPSVASNYLGAVVQVKAALDLLDVELKSVSDDLAQEVTDRNTQVTAHTSRNDNPHGVSRAQLNVYSTTEVDALIAALVDSSPTTLNTLNELAAALGDDPNFATTIAAQIGGVQDNLTAEISARQNADAAHAALINNPHSVTAAQASISAALANYINLSGNANQALIDLDTQLKTVTDNLSTEENTRSNADASIQSQLDTHTGRVDNPHSVKGTQVALENVATAELISLAGNVEAALKLLDADVYLNNANRHNHSNKAILDATQQSFTTVLKNKLDGIAENANLYTHPSTHPATMIVEDTGHRFITDVERTSWNSKAEGNHLHDDRYYTEGEITTLLAGKSNVGHSHVEADITDLDKYTQAAVNALLNQKVFLTAANQTITGNLVITGDLDVQGGFTSTPLEVLEIAAHEIVLNEGITTPTDAKVRVDRGSGNTDFNLIYVESTGEYKAGLVGSERYVLVMQDLPTDEGVMIYDTDTKEAKTVAQATAFNKAFAGNGSANTVSRSDHNHATAYAALSHTHVESEITDLDKYTQAQVNSLLSGKSDITHNHSTLYEPKNSNIQAHIGDASKHRIINDASTLNSELFSAAEIISRLATKSATSHLHDGRYSLLGHEHVLADITDYVAYSHPSSHPATMITTDSTHRFVTDAEKTTWNAKATTSYVDTAIANLLASAPGTLDTLNELAAALGDDPNFATTMTNALAGKEPVITKNTAFNKAFGTAAGTVAEGNHTHDEHIRDIIGATLVQGSNITITVDDAANTITLASSYVNTWRGIDDTPVNGQTGESISSNWAYDHVATHPAPTNRDTRNQIAGTYNTIIGTDSDINTSGATIIDNIYVTDGVITSMGTRVLTKTDLSLGNVDNTADSVKNVNKANKVTVVTTCPTANNTDGYKFYKGAACATHYTGYIYLETS